MRNNENVNEQKTKNWRQKLNYLQGHNFSTHGALWQKSFHECFFFNLTGTGGAVCKGATPSVEQ